MIRLWCPFWKITSAFAPTYKGNHMDLLLYIFAFVFFVIAAVGVPTSRFNLVTAGLACLIATLIFHGYRA
jgi:hypothetical protein